MNRDSRRTRPVPSIGRAPPATLHSWKEIAAYLGRDERTARRWEKADGLPVHRLQHGKSGNVFAHTAELDAWLASRTDVSLKASSTPASWWSRPPVAVAVLAVIAIGAFALWLAPSRKARLTQVPVAAPLTSDPGVEMEPRLSHDAQRLAYTSDVGNRNSFDIYVRAFTSEAARRLTRDPANDYGPAWSPDGTSIAFLRQTSATSAAIFVAALGGEERKVADIGAVMWPDWSRPGGFFAWSSNGKYLLVAGRLESESVDRLLRININSGDILPLTSPPRGSVGDTGPAISRDGKFLAFSRRLSWNVSDLCVAPLGPEAILSGEVRRIETGARWNVSPVWMPDGRELIFSSGQMESPHLARVAPFGSTGPERLAGVGDYAWHPSVAAAADGKVRLVYTRHFESVNLWRQPIRQPGPAVQLIASAHWSYEPDYSPDGKHIAFLSDRGGHAEIWVTDAEGGNPQQWTFLKQAGLGAPRWFPDGKRIAFTVPGSDGSSIHVIDGPGKIPRALPGSERSGYVSCSPDGQAIYFNSNRGGSTEIWKIPPEGGQAVRVTTHGGRVPALSHDGRALFYLRLRSAAGDQELFRTPVAGGREEKLLEFVDAFSVSRTGIAFKYYRPGVRPEGPDFRFFRFETGVTERLPRPERPLRYGVAVSPDGRYILYSQPDYEVSDLMVVDAL